MYDHHIKAWKQENRRARREALAAMSRRAHDTLRKEVA
jgi:hypothetical protein